ncbi:MAG TPA: GEVED domain-containing protein, partial [Anaerolineae bacterium]|nr:GEVED domain-containing protein [Anaerolineae bacterium]
MKTKRLLSIVAIIFLGVVLTSVVLGAADAKEIPFSRTNTILQPDDFGDAPDPTYPTLMASNGARHTFDDITFLGNPPDLEPDGQPDAFATGDDLDGNDDEDGVLFTSPLLIGQVAAVDVEASVEGLLNAWLDFNIDGDWADSGEQIFTDQPLVAGTNSLTFGVPPDAVPGIS